MRIPIVNENDEVIGCKERNDRNPEEITRVSALWITDKEGNILLAQRAFTKKHHPGLWGPAVAGSVEEGETYESNMVKEAQEEIGLVGFEFKVGPKERRSSIHEYFCQWFVAEVDHDYPFVKQDSEVEKIGWFSKDEIENLLNEKPEIFLSGFERFKKLFF